MTSILLTPQDLLSASLLLLLDGAPSVILGLGLHRRIALAAIRMVVQLLLVGFVLRFVFAAGSAGVTLGVVVLMVAVAAREIGARPKARLGRLGN